MRKFLVFDTETGGLNPEKTMLLTATFRVLDAQLQQLDQLELKLKAEDSVYHVTPQAMKVNKIDLIEHDKEALTYAQAKPRLLTFLNRHSAGGGAKLTPVGKNIPFDNSFINEHLIPKHEWEQHVSYRFLDIDCVALFLKICHIIPGSVKENLGGMAEFFGVSEYGAHNATVDVNMTTNILKAMKTRITDK